ncbi:MAG: AI-2E family transporter [Pyrinomonadaceae bacterium]
MPGTASENSFTRKVMLTIGLVCLTLLLLLFAYYTFDVLLLIFAAALLAIFLRGIADVVARYTKLTEGLSVLAVSILIVGVLAGAIAVLAPDVGNQVQHLRETLPSSAREASAYISQFGWGRALVEQLPSVEVVWNSISGFALLEGVGGFFSSTIGAVGNFFIVILLSIYLAIEPRFYTRGFTNLFSIGKRTRVRQILFAVGDTLRWWLIGKVCSMVFIGLLTWIGLSLLGVPLALALGLIAGLLSFIPNFGPIISALPAILLGFVESPMQGLYVLILYVGIQLIESNLVTPFIERETVELPPALTIVFQLALAALVGGLGLVLATPLLAVLIVVVQMVYVEDILGDRPVEIANVPATKESLDEASERGGAVKEK